MVAATSVNAASRSWSRYAGQAPPGNALGSCCAVHAAVGCSVTATCTTRRRSWVRMTIRKSSRVGRGRHHKEVGRHHLTDVIRQERPPGLRWWRSATVHVFRDRGLAHGRHRVSEAHHGSEAHPREDSRQTSYGLASGSRLGCQADRCAVCSSTSRTGETRGGARPRPAPASRGRARPASRSTCARTTSRAGGQPRPDVRAVDESVEEPGAGASAPESPDAAPRASKRATEPKELPKRRRASPIEGYATATRTSTIRVYDISGRHSLLWSVKLASVVFVGFSAQRDVRRFPPLLRQPY
jgi:hypothetical protein